jgi:hypothetical protein
MSIRWLRNVLIEGEKSTVEIQLGDRHIGDKCYARVNNEPERWFKNFFDSRDEIIAQGIDMLKQWLKGKAVTYPDGRDYDWQ